MSIVERALKRLLDSRQAAEAASAGPRPGESVAAPSGASIATDLRPARPNKIVRVNRDALRVAGLLPPEPEERELGNQFRQIKRPLIAKATGRNTSPVANGQLVMVTAALPGDGKTFTSVNLSLSMALEKDVNVVLVDADFAKPHVSRVFGVTEDPGLLDVLLDDSLDVESTIIPTDVPGLSLLPAGRHVETATELLASARMQEVVARMSACDPKRIVLFDSSPLLLTSEPRVLAQQVGQVVLVVRAGITPQQAVLDAVSYLDTGRQSVGLVLNGSKNASPGGYYGYGGYGA